MDGSPLSIRGKDGGTQVGVHVGAEHLGRGPGPVFGFTGSTIGGGKKAVVGVVVYILLIVSVVVSTTTLVAKLGNGRNGSVTLLSRGVSVATGEASRTLRGISLRVRTLARGGCRRVLGVGRSLDTGTRGRSRGVNRTVAKVRRDGRGGLSRVQGAMGRGLSRALGHHVDDSFGAISRRLALICRDLKRVGALSTNIASGIGSLGHILAGIGTHNA